MYVKPEVTRYSGTELLDLMGPVETAYSCELSVAWSDDCWRLVSVGVSENIDIDDLVEAIGWDVRPDPDNGQCSPDDGVVVGSDECTDGEAICCFDFEDSDEDEIWVNMCCLLECGPERGPEEWNLELSFFDDSPPVNPVATCDVDIELCSGGGDCVLPPPPSSPP